MQAEVKGGIDKLYVTFSTSISIEEVVSRLFINLPFSSFVEHNDGGKHYQTRYSLTTLNSYITPTGERRKTKGGDCLVNIYTDPIQSDRRLHRNERNLVAINGLAFSDSALNGLRPQKGTPSLDLQHLCNAILELGGHITAIDAYLDDYAGILPIEKYVYDYSRPSKYKLHIKSNLIKNIKGKRNLPRIFETSCYYGRGTQAVLYPKHLNPRQGIYSTDNQLKHPINRFELRFRKALAKKVGHQIIVAIAYMNIRLDDSEPASATAIIAGVVSKYFSFIEPTKTNKHRARLDPAWGRFIEAGLVATTDTTTV